MRWSRKLIALSAAACTGLAAWATVYTWTGDGANPRWSTCGNWDPPKVLPCYPAGTADSGVIPVAGTGKIWSIDLIDVTIEHFKVQGDTAFGTTKAAATLEVSGLLSLKGGEDGISVTIDDAEIKTVPPG